jgi:hypothetical protein
MTALTKFESLITDIRLRSTRPLLGSIASYKKMPVTSVTKVMDEKIIIGKRGLMKKEKNLGSLTPKSLTLHSLK